MITLFKNRQPASQIVLSSTAGPAERRAASEFQRILKRMGGMNLLVLRNPAELSSIGADEFHTGHEDTAGGVYIGWAPTRNLR